MAKAVHVIISGHVQGVFFRAWTTEEATARGLSGWVRNLSNGTVEAVFSGADGAVDAMVKACWQGSRFSNVSAVTVAPSEPPMVPGFQGLPSV